MFRTTYQALAFGLTAMLVCDGPAIAAETERKHELTLYAARGVDSDLLQFIPKLIHGT